MARLREKRNSKEVTSSKRQSEGTALYYTAFWSLATLLFLSPFFRGLFFAENQYIALFFMTIVFWLIWFWKCFQNRVGFFCSPMDYAVFALPLVYLISAFNAANTGAAVNEVVKNTLYFMLFWSVSRFITNKESAERLMMVIYAAAVGVAMAGLLTATGIVVNIEDGFLDGRIYSSLQYPNALASYLVAALYIGLYLWQKYSGLATAGIAESDKKSVKRHFWFIYIAPYLYSAGTYIIGVVLVGTKSNGGFLTLGLTMAIYFVLVRGPERIRLLVHLLTVFIPAAAAAFLFIRFALENAAAMAWMSVLAGALLVLILQYLNGIITSRGFWDTFWKRRILLVLGAAAFILIGGLFVYSYTSIHQDLVSKMIAEFRLRNASERIYFYSDALKMVKEHPFTGWGGGGWAEAYQSYQGYLYSSKQVHSYYVQLLVEAGALGLLVVLGIGLLFLRLIYALYRNYPDKHMVYTIFIAILAVAGHAAIDFNLSLAALTMVLFTLLGIAAGLHASMKSADSGLSKSPVVQRRTKDYISAGVVSAACILVIFTAGSFSSAAGSARDAGTALQRGDLNSAVSFMSLAVKNNPFNGEYNMSLARLYAGQKKYDIAITHVRTALSKKRFDPVIYSYLAELYLASGQYEQAVENAEEAVSRAPYVEIWYNTLSRICFYSGLNLELKGQKQEARQMFIKAAEVESRINLQVSKLGLVEKSLWNVAPMLAPTDYTRLYAGASYCLMGEFDKAESNLKAVQGDNKVKSEALLWLSLTAKRQGDLAVSSQLIDQAKALVPDAEKQFSYIFSLLDKA